MSEFRLPTDPALWYNKDSELLRIEQEEMAAVSPYSKLGFLISAKALYWLVDIPFDGEMWKFMFLYHNTFPEKPLSVIPVVGNAEQLRYKLVPEARRFFSVDSVVNQPCIVLYENNTGYHAVSDCLESLIEFLERYALR